VIIARLGIITSLWREIISSTTFRPGTPLRCRGLLTGTSVLPQGSPGAFEGVILDSIGEDVLDSIGEGVGMT
jgi:hypothetical protein